MARGTGGEGLDAVKAADGDQKTCIHCGNTMTYRTESGTNRTMQHLPAGSRATGWFCAVCPHTEIHVVMSENITGRRPPHS